METLVNIPNDYLCPTTLEEIKGAVEVYKVSHNLKSLQKLHTIHLKYILF